MKLIDNFLNSTTMYRLVLYYLILLILAAFVFSSLNLLPFKLAPLFLSTVFLVLVTYVANKIFALIFKVSANIESVYITALILALIISPANTFSQLTFLFWAALLAIASKYIIAFNKKHIFNPAAIALVITAFTIQKSASWWVGTSVMLPFVLLGGLLVVRKIKRKELVGTFLGISFLAIISLSFSNGSDFYTSISRLILDSPLLFFAFVMLTEPLTTPPNVKLQIAYGLLVGILFAPQTHFGPLYPTPEIALVLGNIFSYLVSPKQKLLLTLKEKAPLSSEIYDYIFETKQKFSFKPGQYLEWTLPAVKADFRGNRRFFTLASSPTEKEVKIGVRFYPKSSSFKKTLSSLKIGDNILAGSLAGDFVLPKDKNKKLVFIAGGIGITPFRSMIKYLLDKDEKREITLLYSAKTQEELIYSFLFSRAQSVGVRSVFTLTDINKIPENWTGLVGKFDEKIISDLVTDWKERLFYLSGPKVMVDSFELTLKKIGVKKENIKTDFFPGFV